jgi:hypothetical protein
MSLVAIAKALGLGDDASEEAIIAAIGKMKKPDDTAMQSQLTAIGAALGIEGGDPAAILVAAKSAKGGNDVVTALQAEVTTLTTSLNSLTTASKLNAATTFVDGEIKKGRQNVKPLREHYIAMHQEDSARVEKEIGMFAILGPSGHAFAQPPANAGEITSLNAEQTQVADQLGIPHAKFLASLQADIQKETL